MSNSGGDNSNLGSSSSSVSQQDVRGKNKRNLVYPSPENLVSSPSSLTEFPGYASSWDKSQNPQSDLGHLVVGSTQPNLAAQADEPIDWSDPLALQLEELLLSNIHTIFQNAIKQLCQIGYSEDIAQRAISRLACTMGDLMFEDLQHMVEYTMLELVHVLKKVKPSLSPAEAMWWLLVCDTNITEACAVEGDLLSEFGGKEIPEASSADSSLPKSRSTEQCSEPIPSNATSSEASIQPTSQTPASEGKSKKECKSLKKKERKKTINSVRTKGSASNTKAKVEAATTEGSSHVPSNSPSAVSASSDSSKVHMKGTASASTAANTELIVSGKKPVLKPENSTVVFPKLSDYYARIPYDKSLGKYVPQDEKDELILKLVPRVQELQNKLQSWTEWANQKVMQATHRLTKDKPELKALKLEKEEFEKEKKILEDNTRKRILDMELAVIDVTDEVEEANSAIRKLEVEHFLLKDGLEHAKLLAVESAVKCEAALEREQKALKDAQSLKGQKSLLQEELQTHKQRVVKLQQDIGKAEKIKNRFEARREQERKLKEDLLAKVASIKDEGEQVEAAAKSASSEIAALRRSIEGKGSQGASGSGGLKRDRECVMCLSEEKSVVFVPCAHQVLCAKCNEIHKREGMKDCPSCRTPIQQRIQARFSRP
ncbi:hypothetical protein GH714_037162 [Hevea brasiliensis]|uniref:RING-type domain-containing protein n=1 Tax=Hevea brasiliensis TaxID=3981 RepID=A0A6A6MQR2_HEVBR|nr:hypothetical protein GH714_037162 [Hevea brasiliensis]